MIILFILLVASTQSVLYSVNSKYQISLYQTPDELAHCHYLQKIRQTGWNRFYSYANIRADMVDQYRGAGFLEGYTTYKEIYYAYVNFYKSILNGNPNIDYKIKQFVDNQFDWLDMMCQKYKNDIFWQQTYAILEQLRYMYKGYLTRITQLKLDYYIGFNQFYYLTNTGDLQDLTQAFQKDQTTSQFQQYKKNCAILIKNIQGKLYVAQNTHNIYNFMLRFHKTYYFPSTNPMIASEWISFTSRPGDLESKDDFYVLSSGLIVTQTSLGNHNADNWKKIRSNSIPTWLRHNVANRLARTNVQWVSYFDQFRSYTHNNQWIIVDFNKFNKNKKTEIHVIDEGFQVFAVTNFTDRFYQKGFIAGYNIPYDQKVYKVLGTQVQGYDYENSPRGIEYSQYSDLSDNQNILKKLLRTNNNEDPTQGNAPRYDVNSNPFIFGQIDQKVVNSQVFITNQYSGVSGPPTSNGRFPAFDWRNFSGYSHLGMPDVWNFDWVDIPIDYEASIRQMQTTQ